MTARGIAERTRSVAFAALRGVHSMTLGAWRTRANRLERAGRSSEKAAAPRDAAEYTEVVFGGVTSPTLLFHRLGSLVLLVHGATTPSPADWTRYVLALEAVGKQHPNVTLLVVADDVGPTSAQRDELKRHAPRTIRTSVVTSSAVARSIVTLIGWIDAGIRAFAPSEIDAAFKHLNVLPDARPAILKQVAAMRTQLSGVGVHDDAAAAALLEATSIEPMYAIVSRLSALRSELVTRRRA